MTTDEMLATLREAWDAQRFNERPSAKRELRIRLWERLYTGRESPWPERLIERPEGRKTIRTISYGCRKPWTLHLKDFERVTVGWR